MPNYQNMYAELYLSVTKAIESLRQAQMKTEEIYLSSQDILNNHDENQNIEEDTTS